MNLFPTWGFYTKTNIISQNNLIFFQQIINNVSQHKVPYTTILTQLSTHQFISLPFLIKLKFIKTIRTTTPTLQYQYILPTDRFKRSNSHNFKLQTLFKKNKLPFQSTTHFYSTILKI